MGCIYLKETAKDPRTVLKLMSESSSCAISLSTSVHCYILFINSEYSYSVIESIHRDKFTRENASDFHGLIFPSMSYFMKHKF